MSCPESGSGGPARASSVNDPEGMAAYDARFKEVIKPIHDDFNAFLAECGEDAYAIGEFFEAFERVAGAVAAPSPNRTQVVRSFQLVTADNFSAPTINAFSKAPLAISRLAIFIA